MGKSPKYTKQDVDGVVEILRDGVVIALVLNREDADTIVTLLNDFLGGKDGSTRKGRRSTDGRNKN